MPVIAGFFCGPFIAQINNPHIDPSTFELDPINTKSASLVWEGSVGVRLTQPLSVPARPISAYLMESYAHDFFNRIHIDPTIIDFGNITPPQNRTIEVWNAFFVQKAMTDINATGSADGLVITPVAPIVFKPLQSVVFTVTATSEVAPITDASITFEWIATESSIVHVVGSSVIAVPWPQLVPMLETLTWSTDVMTALDGTEQAISLRELPRQTYQITLHPKDFTGAQHAIFGGYGRGFAVPSIDEGQPCVVASGAQAVICDTTQGDWREMAMIWASETDFEIVEIAEVLPDRLMLARPTTAGRAGRVYPTATARIVADPSRTTFGFAGMIDVTFEFTRTADLAGSAAPVQWNGYDVLLKSPALNPVDDTATQRIEALDNGTGWATDDRYWNRTKVSRPMRWVVKRAEMWPLRRWLHRRRGQWRPFYQPSFEPDFTPVGTGIVGAVLVALANGFERYGKTKAIAIRKTDGTYLFANIQSVTTQGDMIALVLADPLNSLDYSEIARVSLMGLKRFASDNVQINHLGGGLHEVSTYFLELE